MAISKKHDHAKYNSAACLSFKSDSSASFVAAVVARLFQVHRRAAIRTRSVTRQYRGMRLQKPCGKADYHWQQRTWINIQSRMASPIATNDTLQETEEAVALTLRELSLSQGDQEGLADFLTDYFGSSHQELGR